MYTSIEQNDKEERCNPIYEMTSYDDECMYDEVDVGKGTKPHTMSHHFSVFSFAEGNFPWSAYSFLKEIMSFHGGKCTFLCSRLCKNTRMLLLKSGSLM